MPNFMVPSLNLLNLEPCDLTQKGHCPKMFLFMLDKLMHAYHSLSNDHDGQQVIAFEILNLASRCYCQQKHAWQPKNTTQSDAMLHICHRDYLLLERLAWAVFDGMLAVGPAPTLMGSMAWDKIVQSIALYLIYQGKLVMEHCKPQTTGSCYAQEKGTIPRLTLHSHHQGSEPQSSSLGALSLAPLRDTRGCCLLGT